MQTCFPIYLLISDRRTEGQNQSLNPLHSILCRVKNKYTYSSCGYTYIHVGLDWRGSLWIRHYQWWYTWTVSKKVFDLLEGIFPTSSTVNSVYRHYPWHLRLTWTKGDFPLIKPHLQLTEHYIVQCAERSGRQAEAFFRWILLFGHKVYCTYRLYVMYYISTSLIYTCICTLYIYYISTSLICTCTVHVHFKYIPYMYMYCTCTLYITWVDLLYVHVLKNNGTKFVIIDMWLLYYDKLIVLLINDMYVYTVLDV